MGLFLNKKLVYGKGKNDSTSYVYKNKPTGEHYPNGKKKYRVVWRCPYYRKWTAMLERCYSERFQKGNPTYKDCFVCEGWLTFSNFKRWMALQEWEGYELDKDLLFGENKGYSPETCVFVHEKPNGFINDYGNGRGEWLLGVSWCTTKKKFVAQCRNPFKSEGDTRQYYVGSYGSELEAHLAWKKRKHEYSCELANSKYVTDERVGKILLHKYENYTVLEDHIR